MKRVLPILAVLTLAACGGSPPPPPAPPPTPAPTTTATPTASAPQREQPPASSAAKESPFPAVQRTKLANGLELAIVEAHALPVVQLRLMVRAGMTYGQPAAAEITGALLKDGGTKSLTSAELLRRIETLGSSLNIDTDLDATTLAMPVVKTHVDEALTILGEVVQSPRFDETELTKLKARETDQVTSRMRSSGTWGAKFVAQRELFAASSPYAVADVLPSSIAKINGAAVRDFHKRFFVPKNALLVIAGDVDAKEVRATAERIFGTWKGGEPPKVEFPAAIPPTNRRVIVVDRPKSTQSDVFIVSLLPPRQVADWPTVRVTTQVYGGGPAGRLFLDVREQRSLAYAASAQIVELAHGDVPILSYAGTQTPKTGLAVQGILDDVTKMKSDPPTAQEVGIARRYLSDVFAVRMETVGSIADMVVQQSRLGLQDPAGGGSYWDAYRTALKQVTEGATAPEAAKLFQPDRVLVVVSGDADVIAPSLSHFGDVTVVDPTKEFATTKTLPKNESAPLEIEQPK